MADIPIQLKFFKKLELYQDFKRQDRRSIQSEKLVNIWEKEKIILAWASRGHYKLGRVLSYNEIYERVYEHDYKRHYDDLFTSKGVPPVPKEHEYQLIIPRLVAERGQIGDAVDNLVVKNFAERPKESGGMKSIMFTAEGLLIGEVINECDSQSWRYNIKYLFFIYLTWITILAAAFITIVTACRLVFDLIIKII
jgi:hypothetical protein